jgi:hypothetical protein
MRQNKIILLSLVFFFLSCDTPLQCSDNWRDETASIPILAGDKYAFYFSIQIHSRSCSSDAGADSGILEKIWRFYKIPYKEEGAPTKINLQISEEDKYSDVSYQKIREDQVLLIFKKNRVYDLYLISTVTDDVIYEVKAQSFSSVSEVIKFSQGAKESELILDGRSRADIGSDMHNIIGEDFDVTTYRPYAVFDFTSKKITTLNPDTIFSLENRIWLDVHYADNAWRGFYKKNDSIVTYVQNGDFPFNAVDVKTPATLDASFDVYEYRNTLAFNWKSSIYSGLKWYAKIADWKYGYFENWILTKDFDFSEIEKYSVSFSNDYNSIEFINNNTGQKIIFKNKF